MEEAAKRQLSAAGERGGGRPQCRGRGERQPFVRRRRQNDNQPWGEGGGGRVARGGGERQPVPASIKMDGYSSVRVDASVVVSDVPFLWGLPFVGGLTIKIALGSCLGLVQASEIKDGFGEEGVDVGVDVKAYDRDHLLTVMYMGRQYLNDDLLTAEGILRAISLGLGSSSIADVAYALRPPIDALLDSRSRSVRVSDSSRQAKSKTDAAEI